MEGIFFVHIIYYYVGQSTKIYGLDHSGDPLTSTDAATGGTQYGITYDIFVQVIFFNLFVRAYLSELFVEAYQLRFLSELFSSILLTGICVQNFHLSLLIQSYQLNFPSELIRSNLLAWFFLISVLS